MKTRTYIKAGMQFGHLTVIKRVPNHTKDYHSMWLCECDCGKQTKATSTHLISGQTISCGHVIREKLEGLRKAGYDNKRVDGVATFLLSENRKKRTDNTTGYTGVKQKILKSGETRYIAQITVAGVRHHLGTFVTLEEAIRARKVAEDELIPKK